MMLFELVFLMLASCWVGESKTRNVLLIIGELTLTFLDSIAAVFKTLKLLKFTEHQSSNKSCLHERFSFNPLFTSKKPETEQYHLHKGGFIARLLY